jgi:hypothetical protein
MTPATKTRPILFNGEMVRAILDGRKSQTRRPVKQNVYLAGKGFSKFNEKRIANLIAKCPFGQPGDILYMRSAFKVRYDEQREEASWTSEGLYITTHGRPLRKDGLPMKLGRKPAMHMPYWLCVERWPILEVTDVRVERVQDISEKDAIAEGIQDLGGTGLCWWDGTMQGTGKRCHANARTAFNHLWDSTYAKTYPWSDNPWVRVVSFKQVKGTA